MPVTRSSQPSRQIGWWRATLVACSIGGAAFAADAPPNIVFIFSDDHASAAISAYNDARKLLETPGIDRIAKEGMRFNRCLVTNSICGPSRATVLTGVYSHISGFYNNTNSKFDGSQPTFPKALHAAGYQTAIIGKWHLETDPTGFDYWNILPGQGVYYNPQTIENGTRVQNHGYVTELITEKTLSWLKQRDPKKPFLLMCQHKAPHRTWEPALRYLGADGDRVYPEPANLFDDYAGRGKAEADQDMTIALTMNELDLKFTEPKGLSPEQLSTWNAYYGPRNAKFRAANLTGRDLIKWKYQRYMHDYLACIRSVDDSVQQVLAYLDQEGLSKNTIVVYAADQGFFLGEHGWFDKRWFYEESLTTPLLVRWPGVTKPNSTCDRMVSNLDFAQTLLDVAHVPAPSRMQGRSFVPLLKGETPADWRTSFYYQYFEYPAPHKVQPHYAVITDQYKLVKFFGPGDAAPELFDRATDPSEMTNVIGQEKYQPVVKQLESELARLRKELAVPAELPDTVYGNTKEAAAH